jgi:hypothetical protein
MSKTWQPFFRFRYFKADVSLVGPKWPDFPMSQLNVKPKVLVEFKEIEKVPELSVFANSVKQTCHKPQVLSHQVTNVPATFRALQEFVCLQ